MASWTDWWQQLQDQPRLERLQGTKVLQQLLMDCQDSSQYDVHSLEQESLGLRFTKYFQWRGISQNEESPNYVPEGVLQRSCARERHALWGARAVAVGCGQELHSLQQCFHEQGPRRVLSVGESNYQEEKDNNRQAIIPCAAVQRQLGNCVNQNVQELYQRLQERKKTTEHEIP